MRHQTQRVDEGFDHRVVRAGDAVLRHAPAAGVLPQLHEGAQPDQRAVQLVGRVVAQRLAQGVGGVGDDLLLEQHGRVARVRVGQVAGGDESLPLEFPDERAELARVVRGVGGGRRGPGVLDLTGDERHRNQDDGGQGQHQQQVQLAPDAEPIEDHRGPAASWPVPRGRRVPAPP